MLKEYLSTAVGVRDLILKVAQTIASGSYQHANQVQYNTHGDTTSLLIVGNGSGNTKFFVQMLLKLVMSGSIITTYKHNQLLLLGQELMEKWYLQQ
jgi:hypothetical protein